MNNPFHAHLDVCKRCEEQPFNLCKEGYRLLCKKVASNPIEDSTICARCGVTASEAKKLDKDGFCPKRGWYERHVFTPEYREEYRVESLDMGA